MAGESLRVRGPRVLVREQEAYQVTTKSGLVIQRSQPTKLVIGEVIAVGPVVTDVQPGDRVIYNRHCGREWKDNLLLVEYDHLEGTVTGDAELLAL